MTPKQIASALELYHFMNAVQGRIFRSYAGDAYNKWLRQIFARALRAERKEKRMAIIWI